MTEKNKVVLTDIYSDYCNPCKMQESVLKKIIDEFKDRVEFKKIDAEIQGNLETLNNYEVHSVPTLIIEKDGELISKFVGFTEKNVLTESLNNALK